MDLATSLISSGHLATEAMTMLAARFKSSWDGGDDCSSAAVVFRRRCSHPPLTIYPRSRLSPTSRQDQIHSSIVSTLLALMDGLDNRGEIVIIGATNRIENIDPSLRRPGRFDREFPFFLPN